jgi:hypothetical protein
VETRFMLRRTNSGADSVCNAASTSRGKISVGHPAAVPGPRVSAYRKPMLSIVLRTLTR